MQAQRWPSFHDEVLAFAQATPHMLPAAPRWARPLCDRLSCRCGKDRASSLRTRGGVVTWSACIKLVASGALKKSPRVTADMLRLHLGVSDEAAALFVADVAASDPDFAYYGHDLVGGEPLPDKMRASLRALYPQLYPAAEGEEAAFLGEEHGEGLVRELARLDQLRDDGLRSHAETHDAALELF